MGIQKRKSEFKKLARLSDAPTPQIFLGEQTNETGIASLTCV
jgi:hypothetical protein